MSVDCSVILQELTTATEAVEIKMEALARENLELKGRSQAFEAKVNELQAAPQGNGLTGDQAQAFRALILRLAQAAS